MSSREPCPVAAYDGVHADYAERVSAWIANPHAYFKAFGPEAHEFQRRHRSERLRTMTLVAPADELAKMRPVCVSLDGVAVDAASWEQVFAQAASRLIVANPQTFDLLQRDRLLDWMGCLPGGIAALAMLESNTLQPAFASLADVVARVQWLFLVCGIRLNEVIVQVDPYTDEEWRTRKADLDRKRAADKAFMEGRRAAQKAWAEEHPDEVVTQPRESKSRKRHFL